MFDKIAINREKPIALGETEWNKTFAGDAGEIDKKAQAMP